MDHEINTEEIKLPEGFVFRSYEWRGSHTYMIQAPAVLGDWNWVNIVDCHGDMLTVEVWSFYNPYPSPDGYWGPKETLHKDKLHDRIMRQIVERRMT